MLVLLLACAHHAAIPADDPGSPRTVDDAAGANAAGANAAESSAAAEASVAGLAPDPCTTTLDQAADRYNAGRIEAATKLWAEGYAECGAGHGFLAHQAVAAARLEHYDDAARLVIRELSERAPTPLALKMLIALKGKVSVDVTTLVYNLGRAPESAMVVPDLQGEYAWIRFLVCGGKEEALHRTLDAGPGGPLDHLEFVCPGSTTPQALWFVYPEAASSP